MAPTISIEDARNLRRVEIALKRLYESTARTTGEDLALTARVLEWLVEVAETGEPPPRLVPLEEAGRA